jgi:WD40 repeat protein
MDLSTKLWDGNSGVQLANFVGHSSNIHHVWFSPDGSRLASSSDDSTVRLWDLLAITDTTNLQKHSGSIEFAIFSPTGSKLVTISTDKTVKIWDAKSGCLLHTLECPVQSVLVAFSDNEGMLANGLKNGLIQIWDVGNFDRDPKSLTLHDKTIRQLKFSPNHHIFASTAGDQYLRIWNLNSKDSSIEHMFAFHHDNWEYIQDIAFTPDSMKLFSSSSDTTIRFWDLQTGNCIAILRGHTKNISNISLSGNQLASGGNVEDPVRLWKIDDLSASASPEPQEIQSSEIVHQHSYTPRNPLVWHVNLSADGSRVVSCSQNAEFVVSFLQSSGSWKTTTTTIEDIELHWYKRCIIALNSNTYLLFGSRKQPALAGLTLVVLAKDGGVKKAVPLCWFPPNINPQRVAASGSTVAVGCVSGQVLLLDISKALTLFA